MEESLKRGFLLLTIVGSAKAEGGIGDTKHNDVRSVGVVPGAEDADFVGKDVKDAEPADD